MNLRSPGERINMPPVVDNRFFHSTGGSLPKRATFPRSEPSPLSGYGKSTCRNSNEV